MNSAETFFKLIIGLSGLVLTILKIVDLSNKSVNKIETNLNILEKSKQLGVRNDNLKDHIEKLIEKKYPKINVPVKRNWKIIIISFIFSFCLFYLILEQINSFDFEFSAWFLLENLTLAISFSVFWSALVNKED